MIKLSARKEAKLLASVSARARKLFTRVRNGHWYGAHADDTPKAMKELVDAGLVRASPRVAVIATAFVAHNHRPFKIDTAPGRADGEKIRCNECKGSGRICANLF